MYSHAAWQRAVAAYMVRGSMLWLYMLRGNLLWLHAVRQLACTSGMVALVVGGVMAMLDHAVRLR